MVDRCDSAVPADELSSIHEGMRQLLPADFKAQAPTWLELLMHDSPVGMFDSEQANFEVVMNALGTSRWFQAYNEVSENGYFNCDCQEAMKAFPVDLMRLGREAFQDNAEATAEVFDDEEATQYQLAIACLRVKERHSNWQGPLQWMASHLTARRMADSVHRNAMAGRIALNLADCEAEIVLSGSQGPHAVLVTEARILSITPSEHPDLPAWSVASIGLRSSTAIGRKEEISTKKFRRQCRLMLTAPWS